MIDTKINLKKIIKVLNSLNKIDTKRNFNAINKILKCNKRKAKFNFFLNIELLKIKTVHLKCFEILWRSDVMRWINY